MNKQIVKIFSVLVVGLFSTSLYATDVSQFDIKGIKLGMSKSEVLEKMPCRNPKISTDGWGKIGKYKEIECKDKKRTLRVSLDHKGYAYAITFFAKFNTKPDFNKLEIRLIQKYGNTKNKSSSSDSSESSRKFRSLCWGICNITDSVSGGVVYYSDSTSGLSSNFEIWNKRNTYIMDLSLSDGQRYDKLSKYYDYIKDKKNSELKDKATNIDF